MYCWWECKLIEPLWKTVWRFIIGDWNAKVGSQETPRVTDKFGLGVQNESRAIEFCQENALVIYGHTNLNAPNLI